MSAARIDAVGGANRSAEAETPCCPSPRPIEPSIWPDQRHLAVHIGNTRSPGRSAGANRHRCGTDASPLGGRERHGDQPGSTRDDSGTSPAGTERLGHRAPARYGSEDGPPTHRTRPGTAHPPQPRSTDPSCHICASAWRPIPASPLYGGCGASCATGVTPAAIQP
jgi:hypothetical protein